MAYASACESVSEVRSRCITDRVDEETQQWLAPQTRVHKQLWRHNEHIESKRLRVEDDRCKLVECASRVKDSRPAPKFRAGQSVHHYWAPWFPGCGPGKNPPIKKKTRGAWFSGEVTTCTGWQEDLEYAGASHTGYGYIVY
jgi:hypothetical protein